MPLAATKRAFRGNAGTPDCAQKQSAVWARPGVVYDAATDKIYAATGNGELCTRKP